MNHRVLLVIPAADRAAANTAAATYFDPAGGAATFSVGLSPDGSEPATHYWASAQFTDATYALLQQVKPAFPAAELIDYDLALEPSWPEEVLSVLGLKRVAPTTDH